MYYTCYVGDHCFDTDHGKKDRSNNGCDHRKKYDCDSSLHSKHADTGFDAQLMCCTCGGGESKDIFKSFIKNLLTYA